MRIAFVSVMAGSAWAASEVLWAETAELALREGHDVLISTFDWPARPAAIQELHRRGAELDLRPLSRWYRRSALLTRIDRSFGALNRFKPDVVCVNQGGTYDIARSGSNSILRNVLLEIHAPYVLLCHCEQPAPSERNARRARIVFRNAAIVGMVAEKLRAVSETHLGALIQNARVFHNPVNLVAIECLPWPQATGSLKLAFVGRLDPVKNLASLIEALAQPCWKDREWTLTVCGAGPDRAALESQVEHTGLLERVRFAGYATDIAAIWREHHALIMPSRFEGVPLAMIEAMLCGRPVVATNIGGISEWIEDGCNGFLISHPSAQDISDALEKLWMERTRLEQMGRIAYERTIEARDSDPGRTLLDWLENVARGLATSAKKHPERSSSVTHRVPKLSVVIPTYEPEHFLIDALKSVLAQDPGPDVMQIAIVDDGSRTSRAPDLVAAIARPGRVEIYEHKDNLGLAGNWNRAIALARGEYVHILHQDDIVEPGFYDTMLLGLESSPRIGMAFCRHGYIDEQGKVERISHRERWTSGVLQNWLAKIAECQRIQCPAAIVRREAYLQLGGFRGELRYALDWEMWVRIAANYEVWYETSVYAHYRRHQSTESVRLEASGRINADLMNAIEMFSSYLPQEERPRLKSRAYRRLARLQLRRASKLLSSRYPQRAADQVKCARAVLERLPEDLANKFARLKLDRLEAQLTPRI